MNSSESAARQTDTVSPEQNQSAGHAPDCDDASQSNRVCDADAFMDEDDADAVAERLRQLGYI